MALAISGPARAALAVARGLDRLVALFCRFVVLVTGIALTVILTANVAARYAFASGGLDAAAELPERLFPWFIVAGIALAAQSGGHMAIDWLTGMLARPGKRALLVVVNGIVLVAYLVLFRQALLVAEIASLERSPVLGLPNSHGYWAIALGSLCLSLVAASAMVRVALQGPEAAVTVQPPVAVQ